MAAAMVECVVCKKEVVKALCTRVRGPFGLADMCNKCFEKLSPKTKRDIRIT